MLISLGLILLVGLGPGWACFEQSSDWLTTGLGIGGGMVVLVGYAMVINMMATREVWPSLLIGFGLATVKEITLIGLGLIGILLALIYLALSKQGGGCGNGGLNSGLGDPVGDIIDNY